MAMLGRAALAMWWDMSHEHRAEFEHWHTHEHYPERLGIPGFKRASRWRDASGGEGIFQLYELEAHDVLSSAAYLARLNAPTPWSTSMMPRHRNMVRSQCTVLASGGGVTAHSALTIRMSPKTQAEGDRLKKGLQPLLAELPGRGGLGGAHLLRHNAPAIALTTEQKIRGADTYADWVLIVTGYESQALDALAARELSASELEALGAAKGAIHNRFQLSYSATPGDIA
jgi:hypothetical protein